MIRCAAVISLLAAVPAIAAPRYERRVEVQQRGPQRLEVDLALLAGAAPRFADLRIYDSAGREVPWLLVDTPSRKPEWARTRRFLIAPTKTTSGIEADAGRRRDVDALRIEGVQAPFLKRVRIEGSGDRFRWTLLADTTVFDLPAEGLERTTVEFGPAELRYVRLTWDDSSSAKVEGTPGIALRSHRPAGSPPALRSHVAIQKRPSEPGRSRYRIDLPAAGLPVTAVELEIPHGDVFRPITISEPRLGGSEIVPVTLGSGHLRQAERNGLIASETKVTIAPPASDELDIMIEDGSNLPLQVASARLELTPQPWIYFEAAGPGSFTARYGDFTATPPRYDLEAARPFVVRANLSAAKWSSPQTAAATAPSQPAPPPGRGALLDRSAYAVARPLAPSKPGMAVLPLDADVLARSRELADVRIVDGADHQVPFIVEQRNEPLVVELIVPKRPDQDGSVSRYELRMPYRTLPSGSRLVLTTSARVFDREVLIVDEADDARDPRVIAAVKWRHADPDRDPPLLNVNLPRRVGETLELQIDEGDNAPLAIESAHLVLPSFALRFIHPGTSLTLLYGNASATTPRYDLALIAPRLFREPAAQVGFAGRTVTNAEEVSRERRFFWVAIAAVALVLIFLLARVLRAAPQIGPP